MKYNYAGLSFTDRDKYSQRRETKMMSFWQCSDFYRGSVTERTLYVLRTSTVLAAVYLFVSSVCHLKPQAQLPSGN